MAITERKKDSATWYKRAYWALLLLATGVALWAVYQSYQKRAAAHYFQVESRLRLVSQMQTENVQDWRQQRLADAAILSSDRLYGQALYDWLNSGQQSLAHKHLLLDRLQNLVNYNDYAVMHLLDTQGQWLVGTTERPERTLPQPELLALQQALETALPVVVEPRGGNDFFAFPSIGVMAPLYQGYEPLGVVWMVLDMRTTLFPLLQSWQLNSPYAEAILTQRTETGIVNVNPMRHGEIGPFENNVPITRTISPGVQAVQGVRGVVRATNYRNQEVLSMLSKVEQSPWWLVLQVAEDEALGYTQQREGLVAGLQMGAVVLLAAMALGLWQWFAWRTERGLKAELEEHMRWLGTAQRAAGLGYFAYHLEEQRFYLSEAAAGIYGAAAGAMSLQDWASLIVPGDKKRILFLHSEAIAKGQAVRSEYRIQRPGETQERWVQVWAEWEELHEGSVRTAQRLLGIAQDITERKHTEMDLADYRRLLENQVRQDPLTQLANRLALDEAVAREWRRAQRYGHPIALLMVDVDHFKAYNDTYGHVQGDACLRQVTQALASTIQREGELVARYGGEEFAVLLPNHREDKALECARLLAAAVAQQAIAHSASSLTGGCLSVSIGVTSLLPALDEGLGSGALFEQADQALYAAKQAGRNRCYSYSELKQQKALQL